MSNHRTPLTCIDNVAADLDYKSIEHQILTRFAVFGMDPRCQSCHEKCAQSLNPHHDTTWECERHPGPLYRQYWLRRFRGGRGVSTKPSDVPRPVPNSPDNGKEVSR